MLHFKNRNGSFIIACKNKYGKYSHSIAQLLDGTSVEGTVVRINIKIGPNCGLVALPDPTNQLCFD